MADKETLIPVRGIGDEKISIIRCYLLAPFGGENQPTVFKATFNPFDGFWGYGTTISEAVVDLYRNRR